MSRIVVGLRNKLISCWFSAAALIAVVWLCSLLKPLLPADRESSFIASGRQEHCSVLFAFDSLDTIDNGTKESERKWTQSRFDHMDDDGGIVILYLANRQAVMS